MTTQQEDPVDASRSRRWWNPLARLDESLGRVTDQLDTLLTLVRAGHRRLGELLMASAEVKASLARIDAATNNIAADIKRLKDRVQPGMTEDEAKDIQGEADRIANKLEGIAADPDNPDPETPAT